MINIEIGYAKSEVQRLLSLSVPESYTIRKAIEQSGILAEFPEIDMTINKVGIFSNICSLERQVENGDRIEIYRPLLCDPKEMRRSRAIAMK